MADAFGNAIGNSVVRAAQSGSSSSGGGDKTGKASSTTRGGNTADPFASIGQSISDSVGSSVNSSIEENAARIRAEAAKNGAANVNEIANAQQAQNNADFEAAIVAKQNAGAQRVSNFVAQSDAYFRQGNVMASRHLQQMQGIQETISNSFAAGQARGEASYLNGVSNRVSEQISYSFGGNDLLGIPSAYSGGSDFALFADSRQNMFGSAVFDKTGAAFGLINTVGESRGLVNAINVLDKASNIPAIAAKSNAISKSGNITSALTNVKGGQAQTILNNALESTKNLKTVGKALPWIYGAAQVGEEVQFAIDNNLGFEQSAVNVTTRVAGTVVEVAAGTAVISNATVAGAVIGSFVAPGVGTVIGGAVGAAVGTVTYAFTDWLPGVDNSIGTNINNAVTNTSREIIGWFQ